MPQKCRIWPLSSLSWLFTLFHPTNTGIPLRKSGCGSSEATCCRCQGNRAQERWQSVSFGALIKGTQHWAPGVFLPHTTPAIMLIEGHRDKNMEEGCGGAIYYLVNFVLHSRNKHFGATWYFGVSEKDSQNGDPGEEMNPITHLENSVASVSALK